MAKYPILVSTVEKTLMSALLRRGIAWIDADHMNQEFINPIFFPVNAGDELTFVVSVTGTNGGGSATLANPTADVVYESNLQTAASLTDMNTAQWRVDSYFNLGYSLPDFGTITFINSYTPYTADGASFTPGPGDSLATLYDIVYEGTTYTDTQRVGENVLQIAYN